MFEKVLFPVKKQKIIHNDKPTGRSMIIREDTNDFISVVSDDYLLIPNRLVIDGFLKEFNDSIDMSKFEAKKMIFSNESYCAVNFNMKYDLIEVRKGDLIGASIRIENSYDTSRSLSVSLNALRLVCTNGLTTSKRLFSSSTKHIGSLSPEDVVNDMIASVKESAHRNFFELGEMFSNMSRIKLNQEIKGDFIKTIGNQPQYVIDEITKQIIKEKPRDLWELYNCATYVTSHRMKRDQASTLKAEEEMSKAILSLV